MVEGGDDCDRPGIEYGKLFNYMRIHLHATEVFYDTNDCGGFT